MVEMVDELLDEIHLIQKDLNEKTKRVVLELGVPAPAARRKIKRAWRRGCVFCGKAGARDLYFHKTRIYVACPDCYMEKKLEVGEQGLHRSIAQRLSRRAKTPSRRN